MNGVQGIINHGIGIQVTLYNVYLRVVCINEMLLNNISNRPLNNISDTYLMLKQHNSYRFCPDIKSL